LVSASWITQHTADLVLREFYLFPKLIEHLTGHHFMVGDEFKTAVKFGFHLQDAQVYQTDLNAGV
jgi:hypothetical protein